MVKGHQIERKIEVEHFLDMIKNYSRENIICTNHISFRLNEKQREIFRCDKIKDYLLQENPYFAGIQYNGCYAVFYKYEKERFIRVILNISPDKIEIVTFYIIEKNQLPNLK